MPQIFSDDARDVALEVRCAQPASSRWKIVAYEAANRPESALPRYLDPLGAV